MLPKQLRLNKPDAILVKLHGKTHFSPHLKIIISEQKNTDSIKWQIKVFKKTYPLSTDRNLAKRKIREAIRNVSSKIKTGANIITQLTKPINNFSVPRFQQELEEVLQKTKKA